VAFWSASLGGGHHSPWKVCEAIGVKCGTTGAVLRILARDRAGDPVYLQDLYIPPVRRRLFIAD
jgi:hypothetical protein